MVTYLVRRLLQGLLILFLVTVAVFLAMQFMPGDPISLIMNQNPSKVYGEAEIQQLKHQYYLDRPLTEQYLHWIANTFQGNLGVSIVDHTVVRDSISQRLPVTFHLGIIAFIISLLIGIPAGVICAIRRGQWLDTVVTSLSNIGITIPVFWLGILLVYLFGLELNWLPVFGYTSPFTNLGMSIKQTIMPIFCLAIPPIASNARQTRSSMLEVMRQDYVRTAWSKGLRERAVILNHALKNSLIPVLTLAGMGVAGIFGGSVLIEQVFAVPGMGRLLVQSIMNKDYPYVQAITLIIAFVVVISNLVVDIAYGWIDPRIRFR
jgi:peptide/nickel transport system permease protein